jgi:hypothetical protein
MSDDIERHDQLVTIDYFTKDMLGMADRSWYYRHQDVPGMPQRINIEGRTRLSLNECLAYMEQIKAKRGPAPLPRRRGGRPKKVA